MFYVNYEVKTKSAWIASLKERVAKPHCYALGSLRLRQKIASNLKARRADPKGLKRRS
jgi:hypothetical protein